MICEHAELTLNELAYWEDSDSLKRLWLAIAFTCTTNMSVIGYNAQHCKNT